MENKKKKGGEMKRREMKKEIRGDKAYRLINKCFKIMVKKENYIPPICKAYSGMQCIHPCYLPSCSGCRIQTTMGNSLSYFRRN